MSTERLDELVIPQEPVDPERLSRILSPYLRLSSDGQFRYQTSFADLSPPEKVLVVLLGELAQSSLGLSTDDRLNPVEIARKAELELGAAYPSLRSLEQDGVVTNEAGQYRVDPSEFERVVKRINS
ncbi:hypothetical protein [Natronorubrum daqingense]|nr:hypothetical protein [Natronorubrum daqingense]SIR34931.1 hypothetical protein SAMN05421809_1056 [Natronorubrum daqingense]